MSSVSEESTPPGTVKTSRGPRISNLVFEGGGIRGLAFAGALYVLEQANIIQSCYRYAGSSAGAITAALLACGYGVGELLDELERLDWSSLLDKVPGSIFGKAWKLLMHEGCYSGNEVYAWLCTMVERKLKMPAELVTFEYLWQTFHIELVITGTCLETRGLRLFHALSTPTMPVVQAVRISISIPLYFAPVRWNEETFVDGGVACNFPLWVFDTTLTPSSNYTEQQRAAANMGTLGLRLLTRAESEELDTGIYPKQPSIKNVIQLATSVIDTMLEQATRLHNKPGDEHRTILIPTGDIQATQFDLTMSEKLELIDSGMNTVRKWLQEHGYEQCLDSMNSSTNPSGVSDFALRVAYLAEKRFPSRKPKLVRFQEVREVVQRALSPPEEEEEEQTKNRNDTSAMVVTEHDLQSDAGTTSTTGEETHFEDPAGLFSTHCLLL